jgi:hypothetical protein
MSRAIVVNCGGQSGVDRAALDVAASFGLTSSGWCPAGGLAEDFPIAPGVRRRYPMLTETPSSDPRQRTAWNVRDSDATLLLIPHGDFAGSPGSVFTRVCAELIFVTPLWVVDLGSPASSRSIDDLMAWIRECSARDTSRLVLNVAGPRESESPGIYGTATAFLSRLLSGLP